MLYISLATQIQQCIAKPGFRVANGDAISGKLWPDSYVMVQTCITTHSVYAKGSESARSVPVVERGDIVYHTQALFAEHLLRVMSTSWCIIVL